MNIRTVIKKRRRRFAQGVARKSVKPLQVIANVFVILVIFGAQQAAAFTLDDFQCANQGDHGGTCFYEQGCGGDSSGAGTVANANSVAPGSIYIMGDSITALAQSTYEQKFSSNGWSPTVEGLSSRTIDSTPPSPDGLQQIDQDKDKIENANAVVIALGSNISYLSQDKIKSQVHQAVQKIKNYNSSASIYWVNILDTRNDGNSQRTNQAIDDGLGSDGTVINWYNIAKNKADLGSWSGGVHPTKQSDIKLLVDAVYNAVSSNGWNDDDSTGPGTTGASDPGSASDSASQSTIVLDPGHAPGTNENVDPATKEPVFDYDNEPEMTQVWKEAQSIKTQLETDGYNVMMTKKSLDDSSTNLKARAETGNNNDAALAVSLHTNPGASQIYYPGVGDYLVKTTGQHDVYNDAKLSATDKKDATTMGSALKQAAGNNWQVGTYDDLNGTITRHQDGLTMTGTMLVTQYFAKVPWIYVEQAQTSTGSVDSATMKKYGDGVVKGIEQIVPPPSATASSGGGCCSSGSGGIDVSGSVSPQVGKGMSASAQQKFQQYVVAAGQRNNVNPNLVATFYYTEMGRTGDSTNNADAAQPPPTTGDGKWIEPAPPVGTGGAYQESSAGYWEPYGLNDLDKNAYGEDGDGDGKIVITDLADATFIAAKYIAAHGGTGANPSRSKVKAVGTAYNGSQYAASVVNTYEYLEGGGSTSVSGSTGGVCANASANATGTVAAAVVAAKQLSACKLPYVWGGMHQAGSLDVTDCAQIKSKYGGADCSGSTSWVLHQAGMFPGNAGIVSGDFGSWGQAGQGAEMTIWENSEHVFIEFNVPGLGHYEMNTVNDIGGPRFLKWGDSGSMTDTSGFTPRHFPGT